jgi:thiamine biosynthesis lipoprotein
VNATATTECSATFACFGARCGIWVAGETAERTAAEAVEHVQRTLLGWHERFSRFEPASELNRLNQDPHETVEVSETMAQFVAAAVRAAALTGGLVDPTLLNEIERAGYRSHHEHSLPLELALNPRAPRAPARPHPDRRWRLIEVDPQGLTVTRPPGIELDSGGVAKGVFADLLGAELAGFDSYAIDCGGDLRIGGSAELPRPVHVQSPFGEEILHTFEVRHGGVATSGIARRSWLDTDGQPAHHLLDPASGRPTYSGVVQATALAPTALEAEARAKAAVLGGPEGAVEWLPYGGLIVRDDGTHTLIEPPSPAALDRARARRVPAANLTGFRAARRRSHARGL